MPLVSVLGVPVRLIGMTWGPNRQCREERVPGFSFGVFFVEGQTGRVNVNGKSQMTVNRACNMRKGR